MVAIEEPERTVHPAATEVIVQALMDASQERQIIITTHSPDIIDFKEVEASYLRVVTMEHGNTIISPPSQHVRDAIKARLYTPGELLRLNELNPDIEAAKISAKQPSFLWVTESTDRTHDDA